MYDGLLEQPEDFLRYAVNDARLNRQVHTAFIHLFRTMQIECLDMTGDDLWNENDIPMTVGKLVAATFERWLYKRATHPEVLKYAIRKLGILDPDHKQHKYSRAVLNSCLGGWIVDEESVQTYETPGYRSTQDVLDALARGEKDIKQVLKARFLFTALDSCSVRWFASRPITETTGFSAIVQGGRCHNENPYEYVIGKGADIDISGCYGTALAKLDFPIGLPTVWGCSPNEKPMTLGQWWDSNRGELVPGLWTVTVSGRLNFDQDLIPSKLTKASDLRKPVKANGDDGDVSGDMVILRQEIVNGILTHDNLQALMAIATNDEWSEIRQLKVICAAAYLKRDRVGSVDAWCDEVIRDRGEIKYRRDSRSRAWTAIPLLDFLGRLADRRKDYKARKKTASTEEERTKCDGMDTMLKLVINTLYGCISSRFFTINNTVVANNVTALGRLWVWILSKALGCRQTITDGGPYTLSQVRSFSGKKPGLATLANPWDWHAPNRERRLVSLPETCDLKELDQIAHDHVRKFWEPYGLPLPFRVEHKCFINGGAYWSKADYALQLPDGKVIHAVRGKDKRVKDGQHPTFKLLDNILAGDDAFPDDLRYHQRGIMKVGKFQIVQSCNGYENLKSLRPGDDWSEARVARYNNTYFPLKDVAEFMKRMNRKKIHRGKPVKWFEQFADNGISDVHAHMASDNLHGGRKRSTQALKN
jgi:hypothetical protein